MAALTYYEVLRLLADAEYAGLTARELGVAVYGTDTSGKSRAGRPLSELHHDGRINALKDKREGHHVYVLPAFLAGRETWSGYHHGHCPTCTCPEEDR